MSILALAPDTRRAKRKRSKLRPSELSRTAQRRQLEPKEPRAIEMRMIRGVRRLLRPVMAEIEEEARRYVEAHERLDQAFSDLPPARTIDDLRTRFRAIIREYLSDDEARELLQDAGMRIERLSAEEIGRLLAAPVLVRALGPTADIRQLWIAANVQRIRSVPTEMLPQIVDIISETQGLRWEEVGALIAERLDVAQSRADFIARNETLTLYGQANRAKQVGVGLSEYVWSTSRDERVRPAHRDLEGTRHDWSRPPIISEDGRRGHPGEDFNCRCVAIPVIPEGEG